MDKPDIHTTSKHGDFMLDYILFEEGDAVTTSRTMRENKYRYTHDEILRLPSYPPHYRPRLIREVEEREISSLLEKRIQNLIFVKSPFQKKTLEFLPETLADLEKVLEQKSIAQEKRETILQLFLEAQVERGLVME